MANKLYLLKTKQNTQEQHLFRAKKNDYDECIAYEQQSICGKMTKSEISNLGAQPCWDEDTARVEVAKIGRQVCGVCVSDLYETY